MRENGVIALDITDPSNPEFVTSYDTNGDVYDLTVTNDYVYVADYDNGLVVLEIVPNEIVYGCTNSTAINYDSEATIDDGSCEYEEPIEVQIGLLNPMTGPIAMYAEAFTDAAELAIDHLNEGQNDYYFILVEADSGCSGTTASSAATALTAAIRAVYADQENLPKDQGGNGSTQQFTNSVIARL
mgnify:CR=1 FL=1